MRRPGADPRAATIPASPINQSSVSQSIAPPPPPPPPTSPLPVGGLGALPDVVTALLIGCGAGGELRTGTLRVPLGQISEIHNALAVPNWLSRQTLLSQFGLSSSRSQSTLPDAIFPTISFSVKPMRISIPDRPFAVATLLRKTLPIPRTVKPLFTLLRAVFRSKTLPCPLISKVAQSEVPSASLSASRLLAPVTKNPLHPLDVVLLLVTRLRVPMTTNPSPAALSDWLRITTLSSPDIANAQSP